MDRKAIFDAVREVKGSALTQADVDRINAALNAPSNTAVTGSGNVGVGHHDVRYTTSEVRPLSVSQAGIDLIHSFESCRLTAYPDPGSADGNPWTIGWGSTGPGIQRGTVWTQAQADLRFEQDLQKFSAGVHAALTGAPVTQGQFDALVSFAYNVGLQALKDSTLLKLHRAGDYTGAQAQFARWNKNDGKVMAGLTRRRAAEAARYAS